MGPTLTLFRVLAEPTLDTTLPGGRTLVRVTMEVKVTPLLVSTDVDSQVDVDEDDNVEEVDCEVVDTRVDEAVEGGMTGVVELDVDVDDVDDVDVDEEDVDVEVEDEVLVLLELFEGSITADMISF